MPRLYLGLSCRKPICGAVIPSSSNTMIWERLSLTTRPCGWRLNNMQALYYLGVAYYQLGEDPAAESSLRQYLHQDEAHAWANYYLAQVLQRRGNAVEAIDYLSRAVVASVPPDWQWAAQLGDWQFAAGDRAGAAGQLQAGLGCQPGRRPTPAADRAAWWAIDGRDSCACWSICVSGVIEGSRFTMVSLQIGLRRDFLSDALKYIPSLLAPALVSILLLPIGTHLFPVATYGNYVLAISALSLLQLVANAWVGSAIIRFYTGAAQDGDLQRLNSTSLVLILAQSAASALICWLVVLAMRQRLEAQLFLLLMIVPVQMFASSLLVLPLHVLRAWRQLGVYNVVSVAKTVLPVAGGVVASLLMGRSVVGMMAGSAAVMRALTPLGFGLCFGLRGRPAWRNYDRSWARKLLYFGAPLVPTLLMVEALDLSDRFIIGAYRGSVETGIYGASYSVAALSMQFITVLLISAGAPLVVSIWETRGGSPPRRS